MFLVMKRSYADFDIPVTRPVGVSSSETTAQNKADELNAKRSPTELRNEISYFVERVKNLDTKK